MVMRAQALAQARELEKEQSAGHFRSPLHGIPIGLKDNIDTAGVRTTAGSKTLEGNVPAEDAEVVRRLKAAGAVLIGKCNMHVFAAGATSAVSYFGPVRNPWTWSGSRAGHPAGPRRRSRPATAMPLSAPIREAPSAPPRPCAALSGFKPTYGRVSIRGIVPLTWSLDHCGPLARTVEDAAMVLQAIAGYDHLDLQSIDYPVPNYRPAIGAPVAQFRLGIPPQFYDWLDGEVATAVDDALALLKKMTGGSREVELPSILGTGAGSEGAVYREALGTAFVTNGEAPPAAGGSGGSGGGGGGGAPAGNARAVDYIREWQNSASCVGP